MATEREIRETFTGLVLASLVVEPDVVDGTVRCGRCGRHLGEGDRVLAAATCYENHSWEFLEVCCPSHDLDRVSDAAPIRAEEQVLLAGVLERAGYRSPDGTYYPDAPTLGAVELLDHSPTDDGY